MLKETFGKSKLKNIWKYDKLYIFLNEMYKIITDLIRNFLKESLQEV